MGCNDYNLHLDGSSGEQPTPEYKIYLGGVGVNGYSPTVDIVNENTASFQIQTNDINGSELTSPIPKLSYLQSDYVSNTSLASTLADYSTTSEIASDYLKIDGSNASNRFTVNGVELAGNYVNIDNVSYGGIHARQTNSNIYYDLGVDSSRAFLTMPGFVLNSYPYNSSNPDNYYTLINSTKDFQINTQGKKFYYGSSRITNNEVAVKGDIPTVGNGTITLTQGGVTKGTFTTNQSGNTTINLDAGGGSITNPLEIVSSNGNQSIFLGFEGNTSKVLFSEQLRMGSSSFDIPLHVISSASSPLSITKDDTNGLSTISLKYDDTTIKVNQDGQLYAVGGGGGAVDSVNGQTGTVVLTASDVGALPDTTVIPTNSDYVDLTTDQTVGGTKTFSNDQKFGGYIYLDGSSNAQGVVHKVGNTRKHLVLRNNQASTVYVGNTYDALNLRGSGTRPTYYTNSISKDIALIDDIPTDYVTRTTNQTGTGAYITGNKQFTGMVYLSAGKVTIQNNNNTQNIALINNTSDLQISTYSNKNIKFTPNGTGKLYYGNNEIATINDIPSISNLADKDLSNLSSTGEAHFLKPTITQDVTLGDSNTYNITVKAYNSNLDMNVACMQLYNTTNTLFVGNTATTLGLRGDTTRPQYNGDDLALSGDLTSKADTDLSNITTVNTQITSTAINPLVNKLTNADITVAPSADIDTGILFKDVNDNNLAGFTTTRFTNGTQAASISAINNISGTSKTAYLNVYVDSSGNDHSDASAGVKSTIVNWSMPKTGTGTLLFTSADNMNGVNFVPSSTKNGYLHVTVNNNASGNHIIYVKNMSNGLQTTSYGQAGFVLEGFIPVAKGQTCQFYYYDVGGTGTYSVYFHEAVGG